MTPLLRVRYLAEYAVLRLLWLLLALVPPARAYGLGAALGGLWYRFSRERRSVARGNILAAGIAASPAEAARIARASFRHFTGHLLENLRVPDVLGAANWPAHVVLEGSEEALALVRDTDRPILLATAHLGCWEVCGYWISLLRPLLAIARPMNNPYVQLFLRRRFRTDITLLPKNQAFSAETLRAWEQRRAALAIVMDQHAGRSGLWMEVLGRPASVHTSPARLHLMTGHPIVAGCLLREGPLRYRALAAPPIRVAPSGDREADMRAVLAQLNAFFEGAIRRCPEQYLWMHRRWRTPPAAQR